MNSDINFAHHIKGFRPALGVMKRLGYSADICLKGTEIDLQQLEQADQSVSLQQELRFYRRLLDLSKDPLIGLKLGEAYRIESYGVLGYAILSAQTLGESLMIASKFGSLSFTHFNIGLVKTGSTAMIHMSRVRAFDPDLLPLFSDRDFSAIKLGTEAALGQAIPIRQIKLMHHGESYRSQYQDFYGCPVSFNHDRMEMTFDRELLNTPMPLRDPETLEYCVNQCQHLLSKLTQQSNFVDEVKRLVLARPGYFPKIGEVADLLSISERTLRRKMKQEGQTFQHLLNEARFQLAKVCLEEGGSLEQISHKLGYSETANFSHAFKRWSGLSPRDFQDLKKR